MAKETEVSKAKKYPKMAKKLHQNQLIIRVPQSMLYWLIKQPQHWVLSPAKVSKVSKAKENTQKGPKSCTKNQLIIRVPQRPWHPIVLPNMCLA